LTSWPWTCFKCCAQLWDNFRQVWPSTTYPCLKYSVFWCWYVMSSWPQVDLLTLNFDNISGVMRLNSVQNLAKSNNPRLSYRRFSVFSRAILGGESKLTELSQGCVNPTSPNLVKTYRAIIAALHFCFRVWISCCIFKRGRCKIEWCWTRCQISHFLTPLPMKIRGGVREISIPIVEALPTIEPPKYIW